MLEAYADDTFVIVEADNEEDLREKLEEEGENILRFFASNRMVANASKTAMVVFRQPSDRAQFQIKLRGEAITETSGEKLLGVQIQSDLKWTKQTDKVVSEVNYALSVLSRLKDHLRQKELRLIADGLVQSKIRYCLPVYAAESLRFQETDPQSTSLLRIQRTQNDMLRIVTGKRRRDHVRISSMLESTGFMSVNQMAAYALLLELWKAREFDVPLLNRLLDRRRDDNRTLRSDSSNWVSTNGQDTIALNCAKLWNLASPKFKCTNLINVAKLEAKKLAKSLPV